MLKCRTEAWLKLSEEQPRLDMVGYFSNESRYNVESYRCPRGLQAPRKTVADWHMGISRSCLVCGGQDDFNNTKQMTYAPRPTVEDTCLRRNISHCFSHCADRGLWCKTHAESIFGLDLLAKSSPGLKSALASIISHILLCNFITHVAF